MQKYCYIDFFGNFAENSGIRKTPFVATFICTIFFNTTR